MLHRILYSLCLLAFCLPLHAAPPDHSWEPWLERKLLAPEEAQGIMPAFVEKQIEPLPLPTNLAEWKEHREDLRQEILKIVGIDDLVPAKWDLKLTNKGTIQRDDYRIEKITFETYPGFSNAALLYVPENVEGKVPGIVSISGHTRNSKAADYVQTRNINLVKRGCVVLSYDYFGMNERGPEYPDGPNSHGIRNFSYSRRTATALEMLDAIRALDVLTSQPNVDVERIGFTGESGGSNSTYWIAAVDPRVKLAVPVSSVTTFDYWIRGDINWDWHQRPPGIRRIAGIGTLLALHAPDPLVIISSLHGTDDEEFPLSEAEKSHQWARQVYDLYSASDAIIHYESTTGHGYQQDKREQLYKAVERWLKPPRCYDGQELAGTIEKEELLRCQLPDDNHTLRSIYGEWLNPLPRVNEDDNDEARRNFLHERLGWPKELPAVKQRLVERQENELWSGESWIVETEPGIRLPVVRISSKSVDANSPVVLVPGRDKSAVDRALESDKIVVAFDLRGIGETRAGAASNWARWAGDPWQTLIGDSGGSWTNWSWFAGRPVAGQWALDIAQIARFSCAQFAVKSVSIDADNDFGWTALLAGAAAPELISSGTATIRRQSMRDDILARGDRALADVPGLLERLDIRQIRQLWPGDVKIKQNGSSSELKNANQQSKTIRVAAISFVPQKLQLENNVDRLERAFRDSAAGGAQLAVAPEGALDGYVVNEIISGEFAAEQMRDVAITIDSPTIARFQELARELRMCLVFGFAERIDDDVYNCAIFVDHEGRICGKHHKMQFAEGYSPDWWFNRLGKSSRAFDTPFGRCGVLICNDRWNPDLARIPVLDGAQFLVIPSFGSRLEDQDAAVLSRACENHVPIVEANVGVSLIISSDKIEAVNRCEESITYGEIVIPSAHAADIKERDELEQKFLSWREGEMAKRLIAK